VADEHATAEGRNQTWSGVDYRLTFQYKAAVGGDQVEVIFSFDLVLNFDQFVPPLQIFFAACTAPTASVSHSWRAHPVSCAIFQSLRAHSVRAGQGQAELIA
jgi:hypothetical protein